MRPPLVREIKASSALGKSGMKELDYAFNPYSGCLHSCDYCYAMDFTKTGVDIPWGEYVYVRTNIVELLRRDAVSKRKGIVGVSTITDPYQAVEGKYRITRESIPILCSNGFHVSIQTKSPLILRDLDILTRYRRNLDAGFSIATPYADRAIQMERRAPSPRARIKALERLSSEGIKTWIFLGPIFPGFNDTDGEFSEIAEIALSTGSRIIYDSYNHFRGSDTALKKNGHVPYLFSREQYAEAERKLLMICNRKGVRCNSEAEDWLVERSSMNRPLF
ncbi:MAG: radical SAM protein [Candidatus Thermoplasmatota archaeon]|jgi:DNA repair photolyase|nr:radical SAM protein [Candidatus Thermoplasmatota archaeon]MCL5794047.1 radical SAM protein [Candidatus Thermoplasmatota archaeon]